MVLYYVAQSYLQFMFDIKSEAFQIIKNLIWQSQFCPAEMLNFRYIF